MLATALIEEIDRLLREGKLSQRKIAAQLRVSRGTVSAIASGRRGLHGREVGDDEPFAHGPQSPPERCPCCGYRVYMPCLVCTSRNFHERHVKLRRAAESLQHALASSDKRQRHGEGETGRHGDDASTRSRAHLLVSPSPPLPLYAATPPAGIPVVTFIPAAVRSSA
jgi:hypothetical protein